MVFFDGLDVTKEIQFIAGVPDLIKRGIAVLVMDGPGAGEAIRFRGLVLRHDYEKAGSACIDFLEQRNDVDAGDRCRGPGVWAACAALEPRFTCASKRSSRPRSPCPAITSRGYLGAPTYCGSKYPSSRSACLVPVLHGADDEQIPLADAHPLRCLRSQDKTLRVFSGEEGGAQHCQRDYLTLGCAPCGAGSRTSFAGDSKVVDRRI